MSEPLDGLIGWTADRLISASVEGGAIIAFVWLGTRVLTRIPPSLEAALWWLAAFKLLLALLPLPAVSIPTLPSAAGVGTGHVRDLASRAEGLTDIHAALEPGAQDQEFGGPAGESATAGNRWTAVLIALWILGVLVHAVRVLVGVGTVRAVLRRSTPAAPEHAALLSQLAAVLGLRRLPALRVSGEIEAPLVVGICRPIVLVPAQSFAGLTVRNRTMVLCHELMHLRRLDLALGMAPTLAQTLFFFHPLVRLAGRQYLTLREAACDAAVLRALDLSPIEYGRLLLQFGVRGGVQISAAGGASVSGSSLSRRLKMLEDFGRETISRRTCWCVVAVAVMAMTPFRLTARTPSVELDTLQAHVREPGAATSTPRQPSLLQGVASAESRTESSAAHASVPAGEAERGSVEAAGEQPRADNQSSTEHRRLEEVRQQVQAIQKQIAAESEALGALLSQGTHLQNLAGDIQTVQSRVSEAKRRVGEVAEEQEQSQRELLRNRELLSRLQEAQERVLRLRMLNHQLARERGGARHEERRTSQRPGVETGPEPPRQVASETSRQTYSRGVVVSLAPSADGTRLPNSTILAVPGDMIHVSNAGLFVNSEPVTGLSSEFVAGLPEEPWDESVPGNHYFVAAEQRTDSGVVRFWGLIPAGRIAPSPQVPTEKQQP